MEYLIMFIAMIMCSLIILTVAGIASISSKKGGDSRTCRKMGHMATISTGLVAMFTVYNMFYLFAQNNEIANIIVVKTSFIIGITILVILNPYIYSTELLSTIDDKDITNEYKVSLKDSKYGDVSIKYIESIDSYMVHADFKKNGKTELIIETPEGEIKKYDLTIEMDTYKYELQEEHS